MRLSPEVRSASGCGFNRLARGRDIEDIDDIKLPEGVGRLLDEELMKRLGQIDPSQVDQAQRERIRVAASDATAAVFEETRSYRADWERAVARYQQGRDVTKQARLRFASSLVLTLLVLFVMWFVVLVVRYQSVGLAYDYLLTPSRSAPTFAKVEPTLVTLTWLPLFVLLVWRPFFRSRRDVRFADRRRDRDTAHRRYVAVVRDEVTAASRRTINSGLESFAREYRMFDSGGLRDLADPEREVQTTAAVRLRALMKSIASGSIGLSGPRGCGKTTVIRSFADGRSQLSGERERLGLIASAPVRYDAREFLTHLFASVCERVLRPVGDATAPDSIGRQLQTARRRTGVRVVGGLAVLLIAIGLWLRVKHGTLPLGPKQIGNIALFAGGTLLYVAFALWLFQWLAQEGRGSQTLLRLVVGRSEARKTKQDEAIWTAERGEHTRPRRRAVNHEQDARWQLEDIRFQQTLASGVTGTLGVPLGAKLGGSFTRTLAQRPWTLPEVVDRFRAYVATLTNRYYLVVGIDELDKMESDEAARRFINDIKGVFGVRGCY